MRNEKRIDNLLGGVFAAKKAQAILLFTPTGTKKKRKHFKPLIKTN